MKQILFIFAILFVNFIYCQLEDEVIVVRDGKEFDDRLDAFTLNYYEVFVNEYEDDDAYHKSLTWTLFPCSGTFRWWVGALDVDRPTIEEALFVHDTQSAENAVASYTIEDARIGHYQIGVESVVSYARDFNYDFYAMATTDELPYPSLPVDADVFITPINRSAVRVSWNESPDIGIQYCAYFHHELDREPEDIKGSWCHARKYGEIGCTRKNFIDVTGVTKDGFYYFDVIAQNPQTGFQNAYNTASYKTDTPDEIQSSSTDCILPSLFLIIVAFVLFL